MEENSVIDRSMVEQTEESKCNFDYSIQIARFVSTTIGLWPLETNSNIYKKIFFEFILVGFCYFFILFPIISSGLYILLVANGLHFKMKSAAPLIYGFVALAKYTILVSRREKIRNCLDHIDLDWRIIAVNKNSDDRKIMLISAETGRYIGRLCAGFMYSAAIFHRTILPFAMGSKIGPDNRTLRPLLLRVYEPIFGGIDSPSYELCFTGQWFSGIISYSVLISSCNLIAVLVFHARGQLNILKNRINAVGDGGEVDKNIQNRIEEIVELHLRVLRFIFNVEKTFTETLFMDFIGSTYCLFALGYSIAVLDRLQPKGGGALLCASILLLISFTLNIFVLCYVGEMLAQETEQIGLAAYMIYWYKMPRKNAKDLILLMIISNYRSTITAGKVFKLSHASFMTVVKTAVVYFNFLKTMAPYNK